MIKIILDDETKRDIEAICWKDVNTAPTGLVNVLNKAEIKQLLKDNYKKLYSYFYDNRGSLIEKQVQKLLFLDRNGMKKLICRLGKIDDSKELLQKVFVYENFSKRNAAIEILRKMHVEVCPYCNRQYVQTIKTGEFRAQFDHYYPKSLYPYLSLSLYNLVPSCSICNMAKSSLDTVIEPVLYPYEEEFGYDANFELKISKSGDYVKVWQGLSDNFSIAINTTKGTAIEPAINNQVKKLYLKELYNEHKNFVKDIIKSKNINSPGRIMALYRSYTHLFKSIDEVKGLLYMTDLRKESWGQRPLTKLIHDIDRIFSGKIL